MVSAKSTARSSELGSASYAGGHVQSEHLSNRAPLQLRRLVPAMRMPAPLLGRPRADGILRRMPGPASNQDGAR